MRGDFTLIPDRKIGFFRFFRDFSLIFFLDEGELIDFGRFWAKKSVIGSEKCLFLGVTSDPWSISYLTSLGISRGGIRLGGAICHFFIQKCKNALFFLHMLPFLSESTGKWPKKEVI